MPKDSSQILVYKPGLRLFSTPGSQGKAIRKLQQGELLQDLGEVSPFLTPLSMNGQGYIEPWLKVRTQQGEVGWVYGAVLYNLQEQASEQIIPKRLAALFGASLAQKMDQYKRNFQAAQTDQELAQAYHQFREVLDSLNLHTSFALAVDPTYTLPNLTWLPQVLPGVVTQIKPKRDAYYFFTHYGLYKQKAQQTKGQSDDDFFDWCIQQFPQDSIEYLYPNYLIETDHEVAHSLLGRGLHFQALQQLDALYRRKTAFANDLIVSKNRCIDDITASRAAFWETREKIIAELTQICRSDLVILTKADKIALETRLQQLRKPKTYGLQTDVQAGRTN
ncbi:MAG: SH3 domain-containing protein [Haliscomenobacter sp.]|uniref:SH3 domain-containing protein n=1 Tax=Haliscomenobacter sp. TaxID=2717303 RepID=UPI0029A3613A|nr:SH3 domain-containing protein [Haliscomenobacter sp.]MDX2066817.1 SH3 domain-containing protein [Haliscomenobacter sp.]